MQRASRPDFAANATAVAALVAAGFVQPDQYGEVSTEILGIDPSGNPFGEGANDDDPDGDQDPASDDPAKPPVGAKGVAGKTPASFRRGSFGRGLQEVDEGRAERVARAKRRFRVGAN
jgi:hypothetical protein